MLHFTSPLPFVRDWWQVHGGNYPVFAFNATTNVCMILTLPYYYSIACTKLGPTSRLDGPPLVFNLNHHLVNGSTVWIIMGVGCFSLANHREPSHSTWLLSTVFVLLGVGKNQSKLFKSINTTEIDWFGLVIKFNLGWIEKLNLRLDWIGLAQVMN